MVLHAILPSNMEGVIVPSDFVISSLSKQFISACNCLFLCELTPSRYLYHHVVNKQYKYFVLFLPTQSRGTITHSWCVTITLATKRPDSYYNLLKKITDSNWTVKGKSGNWYYLENLHPCTRLFFFFFFFLSSFNLRFKKLILFGILTSLHLILCCLKHVKTQICLLAQMISQWHKITKMCLNQRHKDMRIEHTCLMLDKLYKMTSL